MSKLDTSFLWPSGLYSIEVGRFREEVVLVNVMSRDLHIRHLTLLSLLLVTTLGKRTVSNNEYNSPLVVFMIMISGIIFTLSMSVSTSGITAR